MHNWFSIKLYDSKGNYVLDSEIGVDTTSTNWCTNSISASRLKEKTASDQNLKDVLYIEFVIYAAVVETIAFIAAIYEIFVIVKK